MKLSPTQSSKNSNTHQLIKPKKRSNTQDADFFKNIKVDLKPNIKPVKNDEFEFKLVYENTESSGHAEVPVEIFDKKEISKHSSAINQINYANNSYNIKSNSNTSINTSKYNNNEETTNSNINNSTMKNSVDTTNQSLLNQSINNSHDELRLSITSILPKMTKTASSFQNSPKKDEYFVNSTNILNEQENNFSNTEDILDFNDYNKECLSKLKNITHVPRSGLKNHFINYRLDKTKCIITYYDYNVNKFR